MLISSIGFYNHPQTAGFAAGALGEGEQVKIFLFSAFGETSAGKKDLKYKPAEDIVYSKKTVNYTCIVCGNRRFLF